MIAILAILLIVLNILAPRSKYTYYALLFYMWIIMAFTYQIADESIYISRYENPEIWIGQTELLFLLSTIMFNAIGFTFVQYKAFMSIVILLVISSTIRRYAKYPNVVLILYFLCPFALNVAQLRNALATAIFIFGYRYLIDEDNSRCVLREINLTSNDFKYIVTVIVASMFHTAGLIWICLLIAKKCKIKTNIFIAVLVNFLIIVVLSPENISNFIPEFGAVTRMSSYLSLEYAQSEWKHYSPMVLVLYVGIITVCFSMWRMKKTGSNQFCRHSMELMLKSNILMMCMLGVMFMYTQEVYRLQEGLSIINYLFISNCMQWKKIGILKMSKRNFKIVIICLIYCFGALYLEILHYLIPTILTPILTKNYLMDILIN